MTLTCEWCGEKEAPFIKLREGEGFICNKCYKELEQEQREYDNLWIQKGR